MLRIFCTGLEDVSFYKNKLSYTFPVHQPQGAAAEEHDREEEPDGIGHPYTTDAPTARESEEVARGNGDKEIGDERHPHDNLHVGEAA